MKVSAHHQICGQRRATNASCNPTRTKTPSSPCKSRRFKPAWATSSRNTSARIPIRAHSFDCMALMTMANAGDDNYIGWKMEKKLAWLTGLQEARLTGQKVRVQTAHGV